MFCSGLETLIHAQPGALVHSLVPDVVDASRIAESLARLAGLLADIPFILEWHVPTEKVITEWRLPVAGRPKPVAFAFHAGAPSASGLVKSTQSITLPIQHT